MNMTIAERVARSAEFAGFGPCLAIDSQTVKCHREGTIHTITVPSPIPCRVYGNPLDTPIQATFGLIRDVWGKDAYTPASTEIKFTPRITTRTNYLWMDDYSANSRLVLLELLLEGVPVWHRTYTLPYNAKTDPDRWSQIGALFDHYLSTSRHSDPAGITDDLLRGCSTAAKVRAGKEA